MNVDRITNIAGALAVAAVLAGCANTAPTGTPSTQVPLVQKKVAYVMADAGNRQVTAPGARGDASYRALEQSGLDALRAVYADVVVVPSARDAGAIQPAGAAYVFTPQIKADFSAPSPYPNPVAVFNTEVMYVVTDPAGSEITRVKANGAGKATFDEFRYDPGLPARRASTGLSAKLSDEVRKNDRLR
ncbi:MAG TPA: hypothetical protein VEP93_16035 [Variovorax sp.]|nr:hypothetical protein [Variovorax sp.]